MIDESDRSFDIVAHHEIVECITSALDARDPYTAGHSQRVSDLALMICDEMGIKGENRNNIHVAAHLHDIGKIGIPDAILNKTDKLNEDEWKIMKKHPEIGANILSKSSLLSDLIDIVLHHHERYDGRKLDEMITTIVDVDGMACGMCEAHINEAIRNAFKVKSVKSSHSKKKTEIVSEQSLDEQKIYEVIEKAGYKVTGVSQSETESKGFFKGLFSR